VFDVMIYCISPAVGCQIFNKLLFCPVLCDDSFQKLCEWTHKTNPLLKLFVKTPSSLTRGCMTLF